MEAFDAFDPALENFDAFEKVLFAPLDGAREGEIEAASDADESARVRPPFFPTDWEATDPVGELSPRFLTLRDLLDEAREAREPTSEGAREPEGDPAREPGTLEAFELAREPCEESWEGRWLILESWREPGLEPCRELGGEPDAPPFDPPLDVLRSVEDFWLVLIREPPRFAFEPRDFVDTIAELILLCLLPVRLSASAPCLLLPASAPGRRSFLKRAMTLAAALTAMAWSSGEARSTEPSLA